MREAKQHLPPTHSERIKVGSKLLICVEYQENVCIYIHRNAWNFYTNVCIYVCMNDTNDVNLILYKYSV